MTQLTEEGADIMTTPIKTVIIPAAGKGTRLLPATKVTAKELLPIYDRPVIEFAIDEAIDAGAEHIVVVINSTKVAIRDHLDAGAAPKIGVANKTRISYVFQEDAKGLGDAILCCKDMVGVGVFGVILPDDIIMGRHCLGEMAQHFKQGQMVAAMKVAPEETALYGIFQLCDLPNHRSIPVSGMVEKPATGDAPSSIAAVGRYILDPMIFDILAHTPIGAGSELQLTDAIAIATHALPLTAFQFSGTRYDCGNHDGLLAASMARQALLKGDDPTSPKLQSRQTTGFRSDQSWRNKQRQTTTLNGARAQAS